MNRGAKIRWAIIVTAFCLLHLVMFSRVFYGGGPDVEGYYRYGAQMGQGKVPYRDFSIEYPPGAAAVFYLPYAASHNLHLSADNIQGYGIAFTFEMLLFDLVGLFLTVGVARRARLSPLLCLFVYTVGIAAIGSIAVQRFDMVPAAITLGAVYAFCRGNYKTAWAVLAIGTLTKAYPAALAPIFLIYQWRHAGLRSVFKSVAAFAAVSAVIAVPFLLMNAHGFIAAFTEQSGRALQLESLYSSLLLLAGSLGLTSATPVQGPISFDILSPLAGPLARYSFVFLGAGALAVYACYWRRSGNTPDTADESGGLRLALNYSFLVILVLMLASKVFSPQFMLWLFPFFPLVSGRFRSAVWVAFVAAACLTWYIYPLHYYDLIDTKQVAVDALILRNGLLVFAAALLLGEGAQDSPAVFQPSRVPS
jgi:uncharacterized membrane protein